MANELISDFSFTSLEQPSLSKWNEIGLNSANFYQALRDGWYIPQSATTAPGTWEVWSYVSSTTFTIAGDVTAKYGVGDKIRLKQGGAYKYFYLTALSYNGGTGLTTMTINAGTDYTLTNSAITDNYISHGSSPVGFPTYFNLTPVWTAVTTNPVLNNGSLVSTFSMNGKIVSYQISLFIGSTTTFGTGAWRLSLPLASLQSGSAGQILSGGAFHFSSNAYVPLFCRLDNTATILRIGGNGTIPVDASTPFGWAVSDILNIQGDYMAA